MKDEIIEIISNLKLKDSRYHKCKEKDLSFNTEDYQAHLLLVYIINLKYKLDTARKYVNSPNFINDSQYTKKYILEKILTVVSNNE